MFSAKITSDLHWCKQEQILMGCPSPGSSRGSSEVTRDNHVGEEAGPALLSLRFPPEFDFQTKLAQMSSKQKL